MATPTPMPEMSTVDPLSSTLQLRRTAPAASAPAGLRILQVLLVATAVFFVAHDGGTFAFQSWTTLGIELWFAVLVAAVAGLGTHRRLPVAATAAVSFLAGLAAWTGASASWSVGSGDAVDELSRVVLFLAVLALTVLLAPGFGTAWIDGLALGLVAVGVLSFLSRCLPGLVPGGAPLSFLSGLQTRLAYPLGYWTGLGVLLALALPLVLWAAVERRPPWARGAAVAAMPVLAVDLYLTSARIGVGLAIVAPLAYFLLSGRKLAVAGAAAVGGAGATIALLVLSHYHELIDGPFDTAKAHGDGRVATVAILVVSVGAGAVYALLVARLPEPSPFPRAMRRLLAALAAAALVPVAFVVRPFAWFSTFKSNPPDLTQLSVQQHLLSGSSNGRWQIWLSAIDEFRHHSLLGDGAGSFADWWAQHGTLRFFTVDAHSLYLEQLGELGVVGLALTAAVFVTALVAGARALRRHRRGSAYEATAALLATLVAYVVAAGVDWMWEMTVVTVVGIVCVGLLVADAVGATRERPRSARMGALLRASAALVAVAAIAVEAVPFTADASLDRSRTLLSANRPVAATRAALDAEALTPWSAEPYLQLGLVAEQAGDLRLANRWLQRAIVRDRNDWRLWLVATRIQTRLGLIGSARRSLQHALALNPRSPLFERFRPGS